VDVLGNAWSFWRLGIDDVTASPLNTGRLAPATVHLLKRAKVPIYSQNQTVELATPTGVAILVHLAKRFAPMPVLEIRKAGYGAGHQDTPARPNVLAIYQGLESGLTEDRW